MIHDELHTILVELMQDAHSHRPVGEGGEEGNRPVGRVLPAEGYLVPPLHAGLLEKVVQAVDLPGKIFIFVGLALEIGHCRQLPVGAYALINKV